MWLLQSASVLAETVLLSQDQLIHSQNLHLFYVKSQINSLKKDDSNSNSGRDS